jgi:hypothetical protein
MPLPVVKLIDVKLPARIKPGVVYCGPTDADVFDCEIKLGHAVANGLPGAAQFYAEKMRDLKKSGEVRRVRSARKFTSVEIIEMKIARAYLGGHACNVQHFTSERWKRMLFEARDPARRV